jgi:alpha-ketoglutarate-dependent taurine dioxygenase
MELQQAIDQDGYVYVSGVGLDNPNKALEEHISRISTPIAYLGLPMVMDLQPQPGYQPASFAGTGEFDMHTDLSWHEKPPLYIGMFCIAMESSGGGIPLLADGWKALADLDEEDAHFLRTEKVTFPPPSHIDYAPLSGPIIAERNGKTIVRFRFDMLDDPQPAVRRYFEAINDNIIQIHPSPGSLFIFDNERMLHGRTGLTAGMISDRHLKRIYGDV